MAFEMFMKLDGIVGGSKDNNHLNEIEILSWQFSGSNQSFARRRDPNERPEFTIMKRRDTASISLDNYEKNGRRIPNGQLTLRWTDRNPPERKISFTDLKIESQIGSSYEDGALVEEWKFSCKAVR